MESVFPAVNKNMDWTSHQTYKPVPAVLVTHSCSQETHPDSCIRWCEHLKEESYLSIRDVVACITHYNSNICNFCVQLYHVEKSGRISWAEIAETRQLIFYPSGPKTFLFNICNFYYKITIEREQTILLFSTALAHVTSSKSRVLNVIF